MSNKNKYQLYEKINNLFTTLLNIFSFFLQKMSTQCLNLKYQFTFLKVYFSNHNNSTITINPSPISQYHKLSCLLHMDHSLSRSRHPIFRDPPQRSPVNSLHYTTSSTLTSNSPVEVILRQSLFELESIQSVLIRIDSHDRVVKELDRKIAAQLEEFNRLAEFQFEEINVLELTTQYCKLVESYEEELVNYSMIAVACPHDTINISLRSNSNIQQLKFKLQQILSHQSQIRNLLLQSSIRLGNQSPQLQKQAEQLRLNLEEDRKKKVELMLMVFKDSETRNIQNAEKLERMRSICLQLESVFESMKLMVVYQVEIDRDVENMNEHFISLNKRLDQPQQLLKEKKEFEDLLRAKQEKYIRDKKRFLKNASNSYFKGYNEALDKFSMKHSLFEKAFEEYRANGSMFDSIYQHKSRLEQKLRRRSKTAQDIQQIRNIYRSLADLQTNKQLSYYKHSLIELHSDALKKLGIDAESLEKVDNYLLGVKIKQFQRIIESGLRHMSINAKEMLISKSELQQLLRANIQEKEQILCRDYIKQIDVAVKLVELFDVIQKNDYQIVDESLYSLHEKETMGKVISDCLVKHLDTMYNYPMFSALHRMFYQYVRDLIILNELESQYISLKRSLYISLQSIDPDDEQLIEQTLLRSEQIQPIFPILKSIRSLSGTDPNLKQHLQRNAFKIYYNYILELVSRRNSYLSADSVLTRIEKNPHKFNSFQTLATCEGFRIRSSLTIDDFFPMLEKIIQNVCAVWHELGLKQKVGQLVKFYFYLGIIQEKSLQQEHECHPCEVILEHLMGYLTIDTELRVISSMNVDLTYKSPILLELVRLTKEKTLLKHPPNTLPSISTLVRRLTTQLQNFCSFKISSENPAALDILLSQLELIECNNDLKQLSNFTKILKIGKRALLFHYVDIILSYKAVSSENIEAVVWRQESRKIIDLKELNEEAARLIKVYEQWASDVSRRMRNEEVGEKVYPLEFQKEVLRSLK